MLTVHALTKTHPGAPRPILDGLDLAVAGGEAVAITGPSGSGKSTLLNLLGTLDRPDRGAIALAGEDVLALAGDALARWRGERLGLVFQDHHLLPFLTARENVLLPAAAMGAAGGDLQRRADELLDALGLTARAEALPGHLSGGERQRVAVARALLRRPRLLLADEPTGSLDREAAGAVAARMLELAAADGAAVVVATHDVELAARCHRRLRLEGGRLAA